MMFCHLRLWNADAYHYLCHRMFHCYSQCFFLVFLLETFRASVWRVPQCMQWWNTSSDNNARIHFLEGKFNFWWVFFFVLFFLPVLVNSITWYLIQGAMCFAQTILLKLKWCKLYQKTNLLLNSRLVKNRWITCWSSIDHLIVIMIASFSSSSWKHFNQCSGILSSPLTTLA